MIRSLASARWDLVLQWRQGFFAAGAFVAAMWIALLRAAFPHDVLAVVIPVFLLNSITITTFYFVAGLVLFEKGEGTLEALVATPLRAGEYLLSKIGTLTALAFAESALIVLFVWGPELRWAWLALGMLVMGAFYTLLGFVTVVRYDSISAYLIPSGILVGLSQLPILHHFGVWKGAILWLWPTQAFLVLLRSAFEPASPAELAYALGYGCAWVAGLLFWARRDFERLVVRRPGTR